MQNDCWLYAGYKTTQGYGRIVWYSGGEVQGIQAHRAVYEDACGPIPEGLELDHLCRVKPCVNPKHLEAVTHRVNIQRRVFTTIRYPLELCRRGHKLSSDNVIVSVKDRKTNRVGRQCRTCKYVTNLNYYHRKGQ